ncbi:MAG: response regulator [Coriobacteriia bacterium]|nr:response regulator [Coriobacteriia bacterium]
MARILVVDDEPHIVKLVSFSLEKGGHEVLEAPDALTGIALARENKPDLILMDVMMPLMTGFEAVDKLKEDPETRSIPVVMLSAKSQMYEQEEGLRRGALRYVCKPFTPRDLVGVVTEILSDAGEGDVEDGA